MGKIKSKRVVFVVFGFGFVGVCGVVVVECGSVEELRREVRRKLVGGCGWLWVWCCGGVWEWEGEWRKVR